MKSGVPQGSCLGPLLFVAYVNDMDFCLDYCKIVKYADDMKVYKVMSKNDSAQLSRMMQSDLNKLQNWADEWQLSFNISKRSLLHYGHGNPCYDYKLNNNTIKVKDCEKDLGVTISTDLKSSKHVALAVKKAETALELLKRTVICRDKNVFLKLYKLLVRPHLEYATAACNPHFKRDIQLIEKVQKRMSKNIQGMKDLTYDERLIALNLYSLKKRRHIFDLTEIFKLMNNLCYETALTSVTGVIAGRIELRHTKRNRCSGGTPKPSLAFPQIK